MADPRLVPMATRRLWAEEAELFFGPLPSKHELEAKRLQREERRERELMENHGQAEKQA